MIRRWQVSIGPMTHLLMDGGILLVDQPDEFHKEYVEALKAGEKMYVVEKKSEIFRFFVDLDHQGESRLTASEICAIGKHMNTVTKKRCYIALTQSRILASGKVKTGSTLSLARCSREQDGCHQAAQSDSHDVARGT